MPYVKIFNDNFHQNSVACWNLKIILSPQKFNGILNNKFTNNNSCKGVLYIQEKWICPFYQRLSQRAQKSYAIINHSYTRVSCWDATADSAHVQQRSSTIFLTLVKEDGLLKTLWRSFSRYVQSQTQQHFIEKDRVT